MENINGKTILAIGAHVGDMELTAGALLASCAVSGGRAMPGSSSCSRGVPSFQTNSGSSGAQLPAVTNTGQ